MTLTVTDTAGTSTTQTFTGQTVSNNGGPSATTTQSTIVASTGYDEVASDGGVFSFDSTFYGSAGSTPLNAPVVGAGGHPRRQGVLVGGL